jgi:hypothetical protein
MAQNEISFTLPVGYEDGDGNIHREGKIRLATALDEIEINKDEKVFFSERYHDILILSKVITKLGKLPSVTVEVIEDLFEVDFRYLQTIYQFLNGHMDNTVISKCPVCQHENKIDLFSSYQNIDLYFTKKEKDKEK